MRYLSIFSGIEAASVAWESLGWEPVAFAEVNPFACAVLAHRFPHIPNLGDVTKIDWREFVRGHGAVDVLIGGSPCQSFSVAGGRESLDGESRLMFEYIRAVGEVRPRWFVWENVPGCLNTHDNAFGQLLDEMEQLGYTDLAWRVLDAQFFGVAQRRRRVFLVGCAGERHRSAAVLFEPESLRGNPETSREKRESLASTAGQGSATEGRGGNPLAFKYSAGAKAQTMPCHHEMVNTLTADSHSPAVLYCMSNMQAHTPIDNDLCGTLLRDGDHPYICASNGSDVVGTLAARDYKGVGNEFVAEGKVICQRATSCE